MALRRERRERLLDAVVFGFQPGKLTVRSFYTIGAP
jgi:hypothetical protein